MVLATINSGAFKFFLVLHLLAAIIGFGTVFLAGLFGVQAEKRKGVEGQAIAEAAYHVGHIAELVIYTVPVWGIILLFFTLDLLACFLCDFAFLAVVIAVVP